MNKYVNEEFIKIDGDFQAEKLDFYGERSPLNEAAQKEYLQKYYEFFIKKYGKRVAFSKAVEEEEAKRVAREWRLTGSQNVYYAYKRKAFQEYVGWSLYTKRASIEGDTVVFSDGYAFPVPCAKYEFDYSLKRIKFAVCIKNGYRRTVHEGIKPTVTGRFIEFRKGCKEIVNLMFAPDGILYQKDGSKKEYHYDFKKIGEFSFDALQEIEILFEEDGFVLQFAGKRLVLNYTANERPDTLFLGGGMQPTDGWSVKLLEGEDTCGKELQFFVKNEEPASVRELPLGKVRLPFGIGTQKNKDYTLLLKRKFMAEDRKKTLLRVDALDPGGEVLINNRRVASLDAFDPFTLDITEYVRAGENELTLVVYPRAPEVPYPWHRHRDYYNAWFCNGVEIRSSRLAIEEPIRVVTNSVNGGAASFTVALDTKLPCVENTRCRILLQKSYPEAEKAIVLDSFSLTEAKIEKRYRVLAQLWEPKAPALYDISVELYQGGERVWEGRSTTGFRTIAQRNGEIYLNGERIVLKGALNMQFLPPYENVPVNHVCPETWQIVQQALAIKALNGNCLRLHQLGYGTSDRRFAEVCDRLGVLLLWTTRLIDAVENVMWIDEWKQAEAYALHVKQVVNHPSIIMWEGSNELHSDLRGIDLVYDQFVDTVKSVDTSRLICPISHVYYGGGIYECGCQYYNTLGTEDESGNAASSSYGWKDEYVVRSAHTYCILLGYGSSWRDMATQNWRLQGELFAETQKAYIVSEFAVIGRQNPQTREAKKFINKASYELDDEYFALGYRFTDEEWQLSQAFQALCTGVSVKQLLKNDVDGMLWCCLWGGANNASYLKPIVDFYGYKKLAFYEMKEKFSDLLCFNEAVDVLYPQGYEIKPVVYGARAGERYAVTVEVLDEQGRAVAERSFAFTASAYIHRLDGFVLPTLPNGYYTSRYTVERRDVRRR